MMYKLIFLSLSWVFRLDLWVQIQYAMKSLQQASNRLSEHKCLIESSADFDKRATLQRECASMKY